MRFNRGMGEPTGARRVLVVDDDEAFCRALTRFLTRAGYEVVCAHTIARAFELVISTRPDVIILDRRLGDEDGAHLLPHVWQELGGSTPPVVLCSSDESELKVAAAVFRKPFDPTELLTKLGELVGS